jgi:two-component system alkaline phosphatase synthesis response regulator PhoP
MLTDDRVPSETRRQEYYEGLRRASERLYRLVETLLDFGRMQAGVQQYRFELVEMESFFMGVVEDFAQEARERGYKVDVAEHPHLPPVQADRDALARALWNLLDNAVKYSPQTKTVWAKASCENGGVAISVTDKGLGIDPHEQKRIFKKFVRAASAEVAGAKGTGLGLTMVEHIVAAHGGQVHVDSEPGVGSTFTILLRAQRVNMARILVVEMSRLPLALEDDLKLEGYEVEVVRDGETASRRAREQSFDLIILDVMLPHKDGFEVCRELRRAGLRTPIILLTAKTEESDKVLGLELGADDYVTKPFSPRELRARVKAALRRAAGEMPEIYRFGEVEVDFSRCELRRAGKAIEITPIEFKLLTAFIRHRGHALNRDRLLDEVWGREAFVTDRAVDTHITNLRKKIESQASEPRFLVSVRGMGYRFDG